MNAYMKQCILGIEMMRSEEVSREGPELHLATAGGPREAVQVLAEAQTRQWTLPNGKPPAGSPAESPAEKHAGGQFVKFGILEI